MGGLSGHMMHPHDNLKLTVKDFFGLVKDSLTGSLKMTEKFDGFNIHFFLKDGKVRMARNGSDLANGGFGYEDIDNRFDNQRVREVFKLGYNLFVEDYAKGLIEWDMHQSTFNCEIIDKGITNIMYYPEAMIILHNIWYWQHDEVGKWVVKHIEPVMYNGVLDEYYFERESISQASYERMMQAMNLLRISYQPFTNFETKEFYIDMLRTMVNLGLDFDDTLEDYYRLRFKEVMKIAFPETNGYKQFLDELFDRFFGVRKVGLRDLRKMVDFDIDPILKEERNLMFITRRELDAFVLKIGTIITGRTSGLNKKFGTESEAENVLRIKIRETLANDPGKQFRTRWADCWYNIPTIEGVTVEYQGNIYKWTGAFAPINQFIGGRR